MKRVLCVLTILSVVTVAAQGVDLLSPGDAIIAVDADGIVSKSEYPGAESPGMILDGNSGTKYLNRAGAGSGFIVTPGASSVVQGFQITTANDAADRDPITWQLHGTNDSITSVDNSAGLEENWTLIDSGSVALPVDRQTFGPIVPVSNSTAYSSYRMLYPELGGSGLMQVADLAFYGGGLSILDAGNPILAIHQGWDSRYPGGEAPTNLIDGTLDKYLNFGQVNSGFIVTPSAGATTVKGFTITTANDSAERDPTSYELYGTNEDIASGDNSVGDGELWTLVSSGAIALPDDRDTLAAAVTFGNDTEYSSYKMLFTDVKDADSANSMQIAEIQFQGIPEPTTICLLGLGALGLLRRRRS
jgi:hypothetical protein